MDHTDETLSDLKENAANNFETVMDESDSSKEQDSPISDKDNASLVFEGAAALAKKHNESACKMLEYMIVQYEIVSNELKSEIYKTECLLAEIDRLRKRNMHLENCFSICAQHMMECARTYTPPASSPASTETTSSRTVKISDKIDSSEATDLFVENINNMILEYSKVVKNMCDHNQDLKTGKANFLLNTFSKSIKKKQEKDENCLKVTISQTCFGDQTSLAAEQILLSSELFLQSPPREFYFELTEEMNEIVKMLLKITPNLQEAKLKLVPKLIDETSFWRNYFFHVVPSLLQKPWQNETLHEESKENYSESEVAYEADEEEENQVKKSKLRIKKTPSEKTVGPMKSIIGNATPETPGNSKENSKLLESKRVNERLRNLLRKRLMISARKIRHLKHLPTPSKRGKENYSESEVAYEADEEEENQDEDHKDKVDEEIDLQAEEIDLKAEEIDVKAEEIDLKAEVVAEKN